MTNEYELLGPAEKMVVRQLRGQLSELRTLFTEGLDLIDDVLDADIEAAMLDPEKREAIVTLAEGWAKLPDLMGQVGVGLMMTHVLLGTRERRGRVDES
jgi:hypothetical protein